MNLAPVHSLAPINPGALTRLLSRRGLIFLVLALARFRTMLAQAS